ncbi:MAG: cation-translocating P-type ATPase [Candidatus Edwardsbacteria bacterium]|jgi:Ca2+-transporting ATPase|nr:cation-translocating P-type ATPase [Candidatus Edwardsbacteria bacterium]
MHFHHLSIDEALKALETDAQSGLTEAEAQARLLKYGPNALAQGRRTSPLAIFANQFKNVMVLVLLAAAVISGLTHDITDSVVILVIAVVNAVIGFIQEYRADKAMAALARMAQPLARAVRGARVRELPSAQLVPGDLILLEAGARIPADARIVESASLRIEESALTGESLPVEKTARALPGDLPLAEQTNMAFMGTVCVYGRGRALVAATGMETELGRIARYIQTLRQGETPLQKRLAGLAKILAGATVALCALIFVAGWLKGIAPPLMLLTAISLAVAAIPESLPAVITIVLSMGIQRMVKKNALVKRLPAVETLGSVTVICSDKTGTLTQNQMTCTDVICGGTFTVEGTGYAPAGRIMDGGAPADVSGAMGMLLDACCLCNDAALAEEPAGWAISGDPTEGALLTLAAKAGKWKAQADARSPRVAELPFDSDRKLMTTVHRQEDGRFVCYTKGAVDNLLARCAAAAAPEIMAANRALAEGGKRVLAFAYRVIEAVPGRPVADDIERGLTFLGLVGMVDPPRDEARQAVRQCREAGIRPVMITGDHPATALAIARQLGIAGEDDALVTGAELKAISAEDLSARIDRISVFARVSPEDKIKIVQALKARGQIVAMTGDGVNDAPALKGADIGVAMGITGTDVSKEAADMILLDDNFATIVAAVAEGRRIYDNIRKFVRYMLSTNSGEVLTMTGGILLGLPLPLLPIQILWINLVTDSLPALSLGLEPAERNIMQRPPRAPGESLFAHGLWQHVVWVGLLMAIGSLGMMQWALTHGHSEAQARTMVFTCMAVYQLFHSLAIRSERYSLFKIGPAGNPQLLGSVVVVLGLQLLLLYWPPLGGVFKVEAIAAADLGISVAVASSVFWLVELEKWLFRRGRLWR